MRVIGIVSLAAAGLGAAVFIYMWRRSPPQFTPKTVERLVRSGTISAQEAAGPGYAASIAASAGRSVTPQDIVRQTCYAYPEALRAECLARFG